MSNSKFAVKSKVHEVELARNTSREKLYWEAPIFFWDCNLPYLYNGHSSIIVRCQCKIVMFIHSLVLCPSLNEEMQ